MTVKVAIDLALDRLFTYEVPSALQEKLAVGQLLSVPFGHRTARGFAIEVASGDEDSKSRNIETSKFQLKPIHSIVDETPFFTPALLELVKRVAAYTAAPLESVLKAALPASVLKRNAHAKEQLYVEAVARNHEMMKFRKDESKLRNIEITKLREEKPLTTKQQWLLEQIVRLGGGWMQQLCRELTTTPATLRALAGKGVVTISPRQRRRDPLGGRRILPSKPLPLNAEQQAALEMIVEMPDESKLRNIENTKFQNQSQIEKSKNRAIFPILLHGITGSGKTEVYLQAIAAELAAGRGAIVMVPEIALTPQTVSRFASRFGDQVAVLHSALSDGERYDEWHRIRSGEARVVVGPRSSVWAPVHNLGLIVVDEEHETSYKQDESPRYHARDVAVLRGDIEGARVILGSATPSLESWMNVERGKYMLATMRNRAGSGRLPAVRIVEMTGGEIFSRELLEAIRQRLDRHEQTILFLNRRGYSRSVTCGVCGYVEECPACGIAYTYHRADNCLRCHICGAWKTIPTECPECSSADFDFKGIGTQRAEAALAKCFQRARILRMDADSTSRKNSHDDILSTFRRGEADILLGTQMIAKGLDFPNVTLVGVLNADSSLNLPDFRAGERTYQLLSQVSGRAGRATLPGEVILQSRDVTSSILQAVANCDYEGFAQSELQARKECFLPPFCHFAVILFSSENLQQVGNWAEMYATSLTSYAAKVAGRLVVSEAMPCVLEKMDNRYRWHITLRSERTSHIIRAWRWITKVRPAPKTLRVVLDVDAFNVI